jgi:hypothetical protein
MEPVGAVASVVTLVKVCSSIGEIVISTRDAPRELLELARTVDSLKLIIKEAEKTCGSLTHTDTATLHYYFLQASASLQDLSALVGDLSDPSHTKSGVRLSVAKWPFKKKKANTILQDLIRARDGIALLIACETRWDDVHANIVETERLAEV